jgi:hypothetical protein
MIEWRWGLEPMTLRDRHATNFADALNFTHRRDPITLPTFAAPRPTVCPSVNLERSDADGFIQT